MSYYIFPIVFAYFKGTTDKYAGQYFKGKIHKMLKM